MNAEQREAFFTLHGRTIAGVIAVALVVVGIQLFMVTYGLAAFLETPRAARKGRNRYMIMNFLLFITPSLATFVLFYRYFTVWWDSTSPIDYARRRSRTIMWAANFNNTLSNLSICLSDTLLLYRCWLIWADKTWVMIIPGLAFMGSVALCILVVVAEFKNFNSDNAKLYVSFFALSIALNIMVTGLIAGRLIHARRRISKLLGHSTTLLSGGHRDITSATAILIESAVPLAVMGLGAAIMEGLTSALLHRPELTSTLMIVDYFFSLMYSSFVVLSPQMIIFRVTTGRSWIAGVHKTFTSEDGTGMSIGGEKGLVFAQAGGEGTETRNYDTPSTATRSDTILDVTSLKSSGV